MKEFFNLLASLCTGNISNGNLASSCRRFRFDICKVTCGDWSPSRVIEEITCDGLEWNDTNPCAGKYYSLYIRHMLIKSN